MRVSDPREHELPDAGWIELEDAETGEHHLVYTGDPAFRKAYAALATESDDQLTSLVGRTGGEIIDVSTDEPFEAPLRRFFKRRSRRR